jgi:hypothetical protein
MNTPTKPNSPATSETGFIEPKIAGRRIRGSIAMFERSCLVHIERLQNGIGDYDSAIMDTLCEAVRLGREYSDSVTRTPDLELRLNKLTKAGEAMSMQINYLNTVEDWSATTNLRNKELIAKWQATKEDEG